MANLWNICLSCILSIVVVSAVEETVNTTSGFIMGTRVQNTDIIKFLGIPYAEPPVREQRFMPPVKKTRMSEIFNATVDGFSCPQTMSNLSGDLGSLSVNIPMSEDCLNLNIFAPVKASKSEPLSVMVWIYGGGYLTGSAAFYDSTVLAELNDVIVVVINYRIGILGFLNTMDDSSIGNFGLRDQCLALQWVNENIEEFGGNTSSITIFGESAGAGSVTQLTMAASCHGLFQRVIAQSGSPLAPWAHNADPLKSATELGKRMGCPTDKTSSLVKCLRENSTDEIIKHQIADFDAIKGLSWVPTYTSDFFTFVPKRLPMWKGIPVRNKMNEFDLMTGLNMEEAELFYEGFMAPLRAKGVIQDRTDGLPFAYLNKTLTQIAHIMLPGNTDQVDQLLLSLWFQYTDWHNPHNNFTNSKMFIELLGDFMFHVSSVQFARLHSEFGPLQTGDNSDTSKTYFYRLKPRGSWLTTNPWTVGASHGDDIFFLFGHLQKKLVNSTLEEKYLSNVMMEYWTNFAKSGDPNEPSKRYIVTKWPTYTLNAEEYIELDVNMTSDSTDQHPYAKRVAFWNDFIPQQVELIENEVEQKPCKDTVNTTSGVIRGIRVQHTDVIKFLGIPYAEPPVKEQRFKPPVKKIRMSEIFNATVDGFSCPQTMPNLSGDLGSLSVNISMSEDCLNLNIFAPVKASKSEPLSVMVWIYGGGYSTGSAAFYDSTILAELNDVIVVVINYRIGILGFLNTMDDSSIGNFGLRDQCLALQWVNENIEEFGGNTSSITIFGESAGAGSVTQLTMAASCQGLFQRVIAQSGSPLAPWTHNANPLKSATELGKRMGCPTDKTSSLVKCLRGKSTDDLIKQQMSDNDVIKGLSWVPTYTSNFFTFVPKRLPMWKGIPVRNKMNEFDLMTGLNMEESELFYEAFMAPLRAKGVIQDRTDGLPFAYLNQTLTQIAHRMLPGNADRVDQLLPFLWFQYTDWHNADSNFTYSKMFIELLGDFMFHVSSVQFARLHAEFGRLKMEDKFDTRKTYFYRLKPRGSWLTTNPWTVGASHADDIFFLFGHLQKKLVNSTLEERYLSHVMMEYWTNFAKSGDPNEPSKRYIMTKWPTYSLQAEEYIELEVDMTRDSIGQHPYARRVSFWDDFIPEQVKLIEKQVPVVQKPCDTDPVSSAVNVYTYTYTTLVVIFVGLISSIRYGSSK